MDREEIIEKLNKCFKNNTLNGNEYLPLLGEFLEKEYPDKAAQIIQLVMAQPLLLGQTIGRVKDYFIKKYDICIVNIDVKGQLIPISFY